MKETLRTFAIALLIVTAAFPFAHGQDGGRGMGPGMMGPGMMGWGYGMGWPWFILTIVFSIALVFGIVFFIRWMTLSGGKGGMRPEESALDILKKRYARGEITKEEYEKMKKDIS